MARYNLIKFGSVYLTNDGTATGDRCRSTVTGLDGLLLDRTGNVFVSLTGKPFVQTIDNRSSGEVISIQLEQVGQSVFQSIVSNLNTAASGSSSIDVRISGDLGDFSINALPNYPQPLVVSGEFIEQRIRSVTINLIVASKSTILIASPGAFQLTGTAADLIKA